MTIKEMAAMVGMVVTIMSDGWFVSVKIMDARTRYGRIDYLVKQVGLLDRTANKRWVSSDRLAH